MSVLLGIVSTEFAKKILAAAAAAVLFFTLPGPAALAAPPTVKALLDRLTADRAGVHAVEAVYSLRPLAPDHTESSAGTGPAPDQPIRETIYYRAPDRLRLNLSWPDREEVFLAVGLNALVMVGDQATNTAWPQPLLLYRLLLDSNPVALSRLLPAFEIDTERVTLTKNPQRPLAVIGAGPDDLRSSQARFDPKTGRLTRLILAPARTRPGYDIRVLDYERHNDRMDWPRTLHVRSGPDRAFLLTLRVLTVNPEITHQTPDPEDVRRTVAPAPDPEAGLPRHPDLLKIKKQMEWLRKKLE